MVELVHGSPVLALLFFGVRSFVMAIDLPSTVS